jgi:hypothetical protein
VVARFHRKGKVLDELGLPDGLDSVAAGEVNDVATDPCHQILFQKYFGEKSKNNRLDISSNHFKTFYTTLQIKNQPFQLNTFPVFNSLVSLLQFN